MRYLLVILLLVGLLVGCVPAPEPDYCYRVGYSPEAWYCEGRAAFPADTLPDDLKDDHQPPVVFTLR